MPGLFHTKRRNSDKQGDSRSVLLEQIRCSSGEIKALNNGVNNHNEYSQFDRVVTGVTDVLESTERQGRVLYGEQKASTLARQIENLDEAVAAHAAAKVDSFIPE